MSYTTIDKPSDYFNTKLYTGNGSTQTISGVGFQPDWTWIKHRDGATAHMIFDSVRGALYRIQSNSGNTSVSAANTLTEWNSDGFALGTENDTNGNTRLFASWNWLAGTSFTNSAGANGADVASAGSVNTDAGFSIVTYSGTSASSKTIFHGLTAVPKMMLIKCRNNAENWSVYHKSMTALNGMYLNLTSAQAAVDLFADTEPTSSVFSVNQDSRSGENGKTYVAYCFAEKQGYSKFGTFTGSSANTFVYLGFKPKFFLWKNISQGNATYDHWGMVDSERQTPSGNTDGYLRANANNAESDFSGNGLFFLSNGIKFINTGRYNDNTGDTYIYMAFAENPFVTSSGVPVTAG